MNLVADMTDEQFTQLLDEYFAKSEDRKKLTNSEIKALADKLNKKINVPLIKETKEQKILVKIVVKVDNFLYNKLPNEIYELVRSTLDGDGIDDQEAKRLIKRLSKLANDQIDIPYIPEMFEYVAIRFVIAMIINGARKKWNLEKALAHADDIMIPADKNASETELESMLPAA